MNRWDALLLLGIALLSIGAGMFSVPAGIIVLGAGLVLFSLLGAAAELGADKDGPK